MNDLRENLLREDLAGLASLVKPVDLHDRVLAASSRARVRSVAGGALALALLVGAGAVIALWRAPGGEAYAPVGSTTPAIIPEGQPVTYQPTSYNLDPGALAYKSLELPTWPGGAHCPSGRLMFVKGAAAFGTDGVTVTILTVESGDVDGDGRTDQVAILQCEGTGQDGQTPADSYQVVAFSDAAAGADSRTLGRVTASGIGGIAAVVGLEINADGTVRVKVADGDGPAMFTAQVQWREYRWQGEQFGQTGGENAFATDPPELRLKLGAAVASTTVDGQPYITVGVTILNTGTIAPRGPLLLSIVVPTALKPVDPHVWAGCIQSQRALEGAVEGQLVLQCPFPAELGSMDYTFRQDGALAQVRTIFIGIDQGADRVLERDSHDNMAELTLP